MRTQDEIRELLTQKFSKEKKRLKSYGTKVDSFQLANVVTQYVRALNSEARKSELKYLNKFFDKQKIDPGKRTKAYITERIKSLDQMADLIKRVAEDNESKRPWKSHKSKHRSKHDKRRSNKSSRHN